MSAIILGSFMFASCEQNNPPAPGNGTGSLSTFVISATVGTANYLLTTDDLTEGTLTTVGTGLETPTGTYWVFNGDRHLFRLVYAQGEAGLSSSYELDSRGRVVERDGAFAVRRFTSMGVHGNHLITTSTGALANQPTVPTVDHPAGTPRVAAPRGLLVNSINMDTEELGTIIGERRLENFLGNGEYVIFSGILDVNGRIFTAPIPMGMSHYGVVQFSNKIKYPDLVTSVVSLVCPPPGQLLGTQYPNEAWIAIFNDNTFENPTLIRTDKISYAAGRERSQFFQMIWAADSGDIYVFSPSFAKTMTDPRQRTTLPAGVVRIRAGANDFDPDYYVNIEALSGGLSFARTWHISDDYFLLLMYDQPLTEPMPQGLFVRPATRLAIFKGETGAFNFVTGLPAPESIVFFANTPYFADGRVYMPVMERGQNPAIYIIDAATATAVKGISVQAEAITSVGRLTVSK